MRDGAAIYRQAFLNGLRPDEKLTVSEWSDKYRMLSSKASASQDRGERIGRLTSGKSWIACLPQARCRK